MGLRHPFRILHLNMIRKETVAVIECILAIVIWGLSFIYMKIVLQEISPVSLIVIRYASGALLVGVFAAHRGEFSRFRRADLKIMALLGATGITLQQFLQVNGQVTADAGVAAFLACTAPVFTVAMAAVWLRERLAPWQLAGVAMASAGGIVVAVGGDFSALMSGQTLRTLPGNSLILLSSIVWALFMILSKRAVENRPAGLLTTGMFFFGMLCSLPIFVAEEAWRDLPRLSARGWWAMAYVSVLGTAAAYLLSVHALKYITATRVAVIQNMEPLSAVAGAALILNEPVTGTILLGGAAIMGGVYLAERNAPRPVKSRLEPNLAQTSID